MNKNKFYNYIKTAVLIISLIFIYENSKKNYESVFTNINLDYQKIFLLIAFFIIIQNLLNMRSFSFLSFTSKYSANFIQWSNLFYLTGLINTSPFWGAGHILRSYEMKKNNYSYKEYVSMYFFIFFWGSLIYSLILIFLSFLSNEVNFYHLSILLTIFTFSLIITSKIFLKLFVKISVKLTSFQFIKKIRFIDYFFKELLKLTKLSTLISNKKVLVNFLFFTVLLICFEYLSFSLIFKILFQTIDSQVLFLFFLSNFLIRCAKPLDNFIGIKESIMGLYAQQLGLLFLEGALIAIIWRLLAIISLVINYIFYYLVNKFLYNET